MTTAVDWAAAAAGSSVLGAACTAAVNSATRRIAETARVYRRRVPATRPAKQAVSATFYVPAPPRVHPPTAAVPEAWESAVMLRLQARQSRKRRR